jgi:hypothetical protein
MAQDLLYVLRRQRLTRIRCPRRASVGRARISQKSSFLRRMPVFRFSLNYETGEAGVAQETRPTALACSAIREKLFLKCELPHTSQPIPERCCLRMSGSGRSSGKCRMNPP